ncbi:hypothetical protein MTO96_036243 [Rhipicephalus appendiculatus]
MDDQQLRANSKETVAVRKIMYGLLPNVRSNYADCVRTLLSWGANLAVEDALGRTVQDMVEEYALDDVSALLSGLWAHVDKYTQSRKQNGQSGEQRPEAFDPEAGADGSGSHGQAVTAQPKLIVPFDLQPMG